MEKITLSDIASFIESLAPLQTQEEWDNSGWQVLVDKKQHVSKILLTLSISEKTIDAAVKHGANLILSHHPVIFSPLKNISDPIFLKAIKHDISIYSTHTNWDKYKNGINRPLADLLKLKNISVLFPETNLYKLVTFVPQEHLSKLQSALYEVGGGEIGEYDHCSYYSMGTGSFRPLDNANPFIGTPGKNERVEEARLELVFEAANLKKIIEALIKHHPYETPAYDIIKAQTQNIDRGLGLIGECNLSYAAILDKLKHINPVLRSNNLDVEPDNIHKIAILLGSGASLTSKVQAKGVDLYITGDMKYHDAELATNIGLKVLDIGHHEGENFGLESINKALKSKFNCEIILSSGEGYIVNE